MNRSVTSPGRLALVVLVLSILPAGALAQTSFFGDDNPRGSMGSSNFARDAFQAALTSFGVDNIEAHASFSSNPTLVFGSTGITATTQIPLVADFTGQPFNYAASGVKALLDDETGGDPFTLSALVNAFGFYVAQAGDLGNTNTISLLLENTTNGSSLTVPIGTFGPGRSDDSIFFFGVITSNPFNRVTVLETFDGDGTLYDDVQIGFTAIPEPSSFALIGATAVGGLYWWRACAHKQS